VETRLKVFRAPEEASKENIQDSALTIGSFDGVHRGHRFLLDQLRKMAPNSPQVVITFDPHPASILSSTPVARLFSQKDQISIFETMGVDYLYYLPFSSAMAELSAEAFAKKSLFDLFKPKAILVGYDFAFGKNRSGDYRLLKKMAQAQNGVAAQCEPFKVDGSIVSSTRIRHLIAAGNVAEAAVLLGRSFYLEGVVVSGRKLGRTIGVPTANLESFDGNQILPGQGVYMCTVQIDGDCYFALTNVGTNPTVTTELATKIEAYILDFDQAIYGRTIKVDFLEKIRDEMKFDSLDSLKKEIENDIKWARKYISARAKV
jgi:riboflavin kinase / FMN adenylyltransferase